MSVSNYCIASVARLAMSLSHMCCFSICIGLCVVLNVLFDACFVCISMCYVVQCMYCCCCLSLCSLFVVSMCLSRCSLFCLDTLIVSWVPQYVLFVLDANMHESFILLNVPFVHWLCFICVLICLDASIPLRLAMCPYL